MVITKTTYGMIGAIRLKTMLLLAAMMIFACSNPPFFSEFRKIEGEAWDMRDRLRFTVHMDDLSSDYRLIIQMRNTTDYPYSNIYFFLTTVNPDNSATRDTIECLLADKYGHWLGKGAGRIRESSFLIKPVLPVRDTGKYVFILEQAMRDEVLHGVADVGIRIEKQYLSQTKE